MRGYLTLVVVVVAFLLGCYTGTLQGMANGMLVGFSAIIISLIGE